MKKQLILTITAVMAVALMGLSYASTHALDECIDIGMRNNLPLQTQYVRIAYAQHKTGESFRNYFPKATLRFATANGDLSLGKWESQSFGIDASHTLFDGGVTDWTHEQNKALLESSVQASLRLEQEVTATVTRAYMTAVTFEAALDKMQKSHEGVHHFYDTVKKGYDKGILSEMDWKGSNHHYQQFKSQLEKLKQDHQLALLDLRQAMSIPNQEEVLLEKWKAQAPYQNLNVQKVQRAIPDLGDMMTRALTHRNEIAEFDYRWKASSYTVRVEESKDLPRVDLVGEWGRSGEDLKQNGLDRDQQWMVGLRMEWKLGPHTLNYSYQNQKDAPRINTFDNTRSKQNEVTFGLWDDMERLSNKEEAKAAEYQAYAELDEAVHKIYRDVTEAYYQLRQAVIDFHSARQNALYQQQNHDVIIYQFQREEARAVDVMEVKVSLTQSFVEERKALGQMMLALANINLVTGDNIIDWATVLGVSYE